MLDDATRLLLNAQNADGGWGAVPGKRSNTEVTAFAVLALSGLDLSAVKAVLLRGRQWLVQRQLGDGSWPFNDVVKESSWSTALALLALSSFPEQRDNVIRAGQWALAHEGSKPGLLAEIVLFFTGTEDEVDLDADLIGWPWRKRSFSWVEPTSYFNLALKKSKSLLPNDKFKKRIDMADAMIYDRMCIGGGWNYGNKVVYGERLEAYPEITALTLVAMQDHKNDRRNQQSVEALEKMLQTTPSGLALSWSILALSLHGRKIEGWQKLLVQRFNEFQFLAENKSLALAILALTKGAELLRL